MASWINLSGRLFNMDLIVEILPYLCCTSGNRYGGATLITSNGEYKRVEVKDAETLYKELRQPTPTWTVMPVGFEARVKGKWEATDAPPFTCEMVTAQAYTSAGAILKALGEGGLCSELDKEGWNLDRMEIRSIEDGSYTYELRMGLGQLMLIQVSMVV